MKMYRNIFSIEMLIIIFSLLLVISCKQKAKNEETYCTTEDFLKMKKIDMHCHINRDRPAFMELAIADNFKILTINTDVSSSPPIEEQQKIALSLIKQFPGQLFYLTTFSMQGWDNPGWQGTTIAYLANSFENGAIGVKVWKNIGMVERNKYGKFIMIDNPKFDPIFDYIEKMGKSVCGHLGEPKNCWLPIDQMTVNNDKKYFKENPEYHMFLHPEYPSYKDQIMARDNMLKKHPLLLFMGAHLGSQEWSVDEIVKHFEMFPNMTVDLAARICHIEKQSQTDYTKVRDFFIKYQDRIMYGTDEGDFNEPASEPDSLKAHAHGVWTHDWEYLTSYNTMTSWEVDGKFKGLKLPKEVVEKIYYKNAIKWFRGIKE